MNPPSLVMLVLAGVLVSGGLYLVLDRTLSRIVVGLGLITNGINVLLLSSGGAAGRPPLLGSEDPATMNDPLPQAMILTAIVLGVGTTAFGLTLAYRSWQLSGDDEVVDDIEDARLLRADARAADDTWVAEAAEGTEDAGIAYDMTADDPPATPGGGT